MKLLKQHIDKDGSGFVTLKPGKQRMMLSHDLTALTARR